MFLLDANVLIEAKNRYYAFDIAPGFWKWLIKAYRSQLICSIDAVHAELTAGTDELAEWAKDNRDFFKQIDQGTTRHFPDLTTWAATQNYTAAAVNEFNGNRADYLLIAFAREHKHTVVTHERSQPNARRRILIPDACQAMGVASTYTFEMLRQTGVRLGLESP